MRFGLKDVNELPSMEEFEKLVAQSFQEELIPAESAASAGDVAQSADSSESSDAGPSSESVSEVKEVKKVG